MSQSSWDRRIARAGELAAIHAASAHLLKFYGDIARFQQQVFDKLRSKPKRPPDTALLEPWFAPLLALVRRTGPPPLVQAAVRISGDKHAFQELLFAWQDPDARDTPAAQAELFFARALMQPYTEYLASSRDMHLATSRAECPFCGEKPQVGVLRGEGEGARRSLVCSLCSTEWDYRRIVCPACGEQTESRLPVYTAREFEYLRIEACDTCHTYLKSVDLTRNGLAVPVVDELASVSLNLWAEENGYTKLQPNLLGI